jgi:hypothetical protein
MQESWRNILIGIEEYDPMNSNPDAKLTDDFRQINGIGPAIERRLHQAGVRTYAQLATLTPPEIATLVSDLAGISAERIAEQDWPGQARSLAPEPALARSEPDTAPAGNSQHDASFTIKLLLNEDNSVRRTQVVDNRSKAEEQWAGWDASRMVAFVNRQATLQLAASEPTSPVAAVAEPISTLAPTPVAGVGGTLHMRGIEIGPADTTSPRRIVRQGMPFSVRLSLDLTEAVLPNSNPLNYAAAVFAKSLGGGPRQSVGEMRSTIRPEDSLTILVASKPLPAGTYRLDAVVTLTPPSAEASLRAHLEGGILHVY